MKYRLLGPTGLRVSELCLGTMAFGGKQSWGAGREDAAAILAAFTDAGGVFVDTAPNYADGASETLIGEFAHGRRDELVIGTKFTAAASAHPLAGGNSRKSLRQALEGSLRRLQTDHVDVLWLHFWDGTTPLDEILAAVDDLVRAGKVLYFGVSDTPAWLISRAATLAALRQITPVAAVQLEYSLAARTGERELLPMCEALDLTPVAWGPLAAGALAGGAEPRRRKPETFTPALAEIIAASTRVAAEAGVTLAEASLAWVLGRGVIPIVGARHPEHIQAAIRATSLDLDPEARASLDGVGRCELGFPHELIASSYLRKFAFGRPDLFVPPARPRS